MRRGVLAGTGLAVLLSVAAYATRWELTRVGQFPVRVSRWSDRAEMLCFDGWRRLERDAFADLADTVRAEPLHPCVTSSRTAVVAPP